MSNNATEAAKKMFTLRWAGIAGSLIGVYDRNDVEVSEICPTCYAQGVIWHLHDESESHKGSPHFKPRVWTPEMLRPLANEMEAEQATLDGEVLRD